MNSNAAIDDFVDPDIAIKRNRVHNIGSRRLLDRARRLTDLTFLRPSQMGGSRLDFAFRVAELSAIEVELVKRHGPAVLLLVGAQPAHVPHVMHAVRCQQAAA